MSKLWWIKRTQLDEAQLEVVEYAGKGAGFVVMGAPGAGKTNLLMLATAAMKTRGYDNSQVVVFTGTLRDFISRGLSTYQLSEDSVNTLTQVARAIVREHGGKLPVGGTFPELQSAWRTNFTEYLAKKTHTQRVFDALLMDESQDFNLAEVELLFGSSGYTAFAIDTHQSIYERTDDEHPVFSLQRKNGLKLFELPGHYRVGRRICRFVDLVMEGRAEYKRMEDTSMYSEEERKSLVSYENTEGETVEEHKKIVSRIKTQLTVYPGERIGILFPKRDQVKAFKAFCEDNFPDVLANEVADDAGLRAELFVGSMHEAKGLEFAVVHLGGQEKLSVFATQRNLLFTSVTRARYACYITASGKVPAYLTSAYKRMDGAKPTDFGALFPE